MAAATYIGRFAPSPNGPLHAGSLVTALASWLDARAHGGRWLVRIEDTDLPRNVAGAAEHILHQLDRLGLRADAPPQWQSGHSPRYQAALDRLHLDGRVYACRCSRTALAGAPHAAWPAPLHCDAAVDAAMDARAPARTPAAWRVRTRVGATPTDGGDASRGGDAVIPWSDRRLGAGVQNVAREVGDFVLRRADGVWAYQLAVVVDDAAQGVTHVVRGADLADNTPRQIHLQRLLGVPTPVYLHGPLVLADDGRKLSKQNGAEPAALADPLAALRRAGAVLGLQVAADAPSAWLREATAAWAERWVQPRR